MTKHTKRELMKKLKETQEITPDMIKPAMEKNNLQAEKLEQRKTKIEQCIPGALQGVCRK